VSLLLPDVHLQACADDRCSGCYPAPPPPTGLSADRRRTIERNETLAAGRHPATKRVLLVATSETCGDCDHCTLTHGGRRSYWKCNLVPITNGAGTDIRKSWPACTAFERAS
jgi:hypothetical protein